MRCGRRQSSDMVRVGAALMAGLASPAMVPAAAQSTLVEDHKAFRACDRDIGDVSLLLSELADAPAVSGALDLSSIERQVMLNRTLDAENVLRRAWPNIYSESPCAEDRSSLECILVHVWADADDGQVVHHCRPGMRLQRFVETEMPALEADGISFVDWAQEQISCAEELVE